MSEPTIVALLYHHVGPIREETCKGLTVLTQAFARQMATLAAMGYTAILPDDWVACIRGQGEIPDRSVMITFDDAYADLVEHALPVLEKHGYPATVFVPTSLIGGELKCNPRQPGPRLAIMSREQIREWSNRGVTFGSHSRTHADLVAIPVEQAEEEIASSKLELEEIVEHPVTAFAYPYGKLDSDIERIVGGSYAAAFTTEEGINDSSTPLTRLKRTMVQHKDTVADVLLRARYGKSVLDKVRSMVAPRA
jgi:peptidoglycan/xylan/chitin deacetylase (PgdA/CDA1 family)